MTADAKMTKDGPIVDAVDRFAASLGVAVKPSAGFHDPLEARWDALRSAGVANPGRKFAAWVDLAFVGGVMPMLLTNCPDVGSMVRTLIRFHPLWGTSEIEFESTDGGARLSLTGPNGSAAHPDTSDAFYALLERTMAQVTDPPLRLVRGRLSEAEPHNKCVTLTGRQLKAPLVSADPALARILVGFAEAALASGGSWVGRVKSLIRSGLSTSVDLPMIARAMSMSPRSLQMALTEQGTTFSALVDDQRRSVALALLAETELSVTRIAFEVGFGSAEGFARAVRRWTGQSPSRWRAAQRSSALESARGPRRN